MSVLHNKMWKEICLIVGFWNRWDGERLNLDPEMMIDTIKNVLKQEMK